MIFYFSATGNTRWAAKIMAERLNDRLINMAGHAEGGHFQCTSPDERIGFCFPVHGWRPPLWVRKYVRRLHISDSSSHYCWVLCTAGDDIGLSIEYFNRDLAMAGLHADSAFSLLMPESYVGLPFMDVDKPDKEKSKLELARKRLNDIAESVACRQKQIMDTQRGRWPRTNSLLLGEAFVRWLVTDKPFRVEKDLCIRCGRCATACPVGNIVGGSGHCPSWLHSGHCLSCFACYHHCPTKAIQYGSRTKGKGQYIFKQPESTTN